MNNKVYPLGDEPSIEEKHKLGFKNITLVLPSIDFIHRDARGVLTGEHREPKKGEWYLSGAIPTAYKARNDLSSKYGIVKLVKIERKEIINWFPI